MEENKHIQTHHVPGESEEKEASSFRLIMTLGLAGFISGLILVTAYIATKPMIEANKAAAIERAIYKVLPGCVSFKILELKNGVIIDYHAPANTQTSKSAYPKFIYKGFNKENKLIGFAILGAEPGFQDIISVMMGYDAVNKTIIGYEVLESKETPGLGDKIFKDIPFLQNFISLLTEPVILFAKKGEKKNPNEVEAITGATISCRAIVRLLNNSMNEWKKPVAQYISSNNIKSGEQ